jgi:tetratricopeptide (TPR) repeat protein
MYCDPKTDKQKTLLKIKELLLQSIQLSPNSPTCHYFLGEIYLALNEERRAHTCFEKVLEIKPDHLDAERHLRILRMRREKHKEQKRKKSGLFSRFKKK